MDEKAVMHCVR